MCGIAGINWQDSQLAGQMADAMRHRGPDDRGIFLAEGLSLVHTRLSILDVSARGHQPMVFEHLVVTYNGEIYNFQSIKKELIACGYQFNSDSDTEVLLLAFHKWGPDCVKKFNGMWAFCIYDSLEKKLYLSRDRMGVKPLCCYFDGQRFAFGSDMNVIRRAIGKMELDNKAINYYFYQKYCGSVHNIFVHSFKVQPGENLCFDLNSRSIARHKYFDLAQEVDEARNTSLSDRLAEIKMLMAESVQIRLVADVPVGCFLSGGLDSSVITALARQKKHDLRTFSIGFAESSFDETTYSRQVSEYLGVEHNIDTFTLSEDFIAGVIAEMDEPLADSSVLPTCLLAESARKHVTVCLSGDGADEIFGGYDTHLASFVSRYFPKYARRPLACLAGLIPASDKKVSLAFKLKRYLRDFDGGANIRHLNWMATYNDQMRRELLPDIFVPADKLIHVPVDDSFTAIQLNDMRNYLPGDILKKADFASMRSSLEVRVPFMDYRLVTRVLSLPDEYKIRYFQTKYQLKQMAVGLVPESVIRRKKRGFSVPVASWLRQSELMKEYLLSKDNYACAQINFDYVQKLYQEHLDRKADNSRQLWLVFVLNYWQANFAKV